MVALAATFVLEEKLGLDQAVQEPEAPQRGAPEPALDQRQPVARVPLGAARPCLA